MSEERKLTPEQDRYLDAFLDDLLESAAAVGERLNALARKEGLPVASPEEKAERQDTLPQLRAELRRQFAPHVAELTVEQLAERTAARARSPR